MSTAVPPRGDPPRAALRVRGLSKRFGSRMALAEVSFQLEAGELVGVVGPNGAGKTTLLSILAGAQRPDAGELELAVRSVGWVPQQLALYHRLSVRENLTLFARLERVDDVEGVVGEMLERTGLQARAGDPVGALSGGNRQRVNIAIGLLARPSVLLLDEPSSALDPRQRERLWEFIASLGTAGTTVVFATHDVGEVERYAHRVLLLADGELLFTGSPAELADAVGGDPRDLEAALLAFLHAHGH